MSKLGIALLLAMLSLTSGCIAAAIPLAAGGILVKQRTDRAKAQDIPGVGRASAASDLQATRLALTELPPPEGSSAAGNPAVTGFREYAVSQLDDAIAPGKRASALLVRASDLRSDRASCTATRPAVFVDLDPGRGTFDPFAPGLPDGTLAAALGELRARGVAVVWFSRLGAGFEEATRTALGAAGLDPAGTDRLVMLSTLDERKQSRRDEEAKRVCPIALVGEDRADFDELYLYLKQPEAALALDAMIGRGWFLASPFTPAGQTKDNVP